jgi:nucleotide-binding universal stress UspA family protein
VAEVGSASAGSDRIVVGIDGSRSSKSALAWAAHQAELMDLPLTVVAVWDYPMTWGWSPPWPPEFNPEADAGKVLDDTVTEVLGSEPAVKIERRVLQGHPSPVLVAESKSAKLLVVGSRGHGEFAGMLIGSVSEFVTTHSRCPVVVIR